MRKKVYEIFSGEYYVTKKDIVLQTLLGSCISVCLKEMNSGIAGINHFMLPATGEIEDIIINEDARYGINAMELLINKMIKMGAQKKYIKAKVFGGGKVMDQELSNVAEANIKFVKTYLNMENISVIASDVGGDYGRKIIFLPNNFDIYLKKIKISKLSLNTINREKEMLKNQKKDNTESKITLFK